VGVEYLGKVAVGKFVQGRMVQGKAAMESLLVVVVEGVQVVVVRVLERESAREEAVEDLLIEEVGGSQELAEEAEGVGRGGPDGGAEVEEKETARMVVQEGKVMGEQVAMEAAEKEEVALGTGEVGKEAGVRGLAGKQAVAE